MPRVHRRSTVIGHGPISNQWDGDQMPESGFLIDRAEVSKVRGNTRRDTWLGHCHRGVSSNDNCS
jgi:hypothetical protein